MIVHPSVIWHWPLLGLWCLLRLLRLLGILLLIASVVPLVCLVLIPILGLTAGGYFTNIVGIDQVSCQIFIFVFVFIIVFRLRDNGREIAKVKLHPQLIHPLRETVLLLGLKWQGRWLLRYCWRFSPSLVYHIWFFVGRFEWLNAWNSIVIVVIADRSGLNCWLRHINRVFFTNADDGFKGFVIVSELKETIGILDDKYHAIVEEGVCCALRSDPTGRNELGNSGQLTYSHHMNLDVLILPAVDLLLLYCFFSEFLQELVLVRVDSLKPPHHKSVFLFTLADVGEHFCLALFFSDGQFGETRVDQLQYLFMFFFGEEIDAELHSPSFFCLDLGLAGLEFENGPFGMDNFSFQ